MNTINIPGFTAGASLYSAGRPNAIIPALPPQNGDTPGDRILDCILDCREAGNTAAYAAGNAARFRRRINAR